MHRRMLLNFVFVVILIAFSGQAFGQTLFTQTIDYSSPLNPVTYLGPLTTPTPSSTTNPNLTPYQETSDGGSGALVNSSEALAVTLNLPAQMSVLLTLSLRACLKRGSSG